MAVRERQVRGTPLRQTLQAAAAGPNQIGQAVNFDVMPGKLYELRTTVECVVRMASDAPDAQSERIYPTGQPLRFVADCRQLSAANATTVPGVVFLHMEATDVPL